MHGIVIKAIEGSIIENFGNDAWLNLKHKVGLDENYFISNLDYDDNLPYTITKAASELLNIPTKDILFLVGEYSILNIGFNQYNSLLISGGKNFEHFLINLPNFHSRIMLMYPKIKPPEFKIVEIGDKNYALYYYSSRMGLTDYMHGLISGLGKLFNQKIEIKLIHSKEINTDYDLFHVKLI